MNLVSMGVEFTLFPSLNKKAPGADFRGLMVITKEKRHFLIYFWNKCLAAFEPAWLIVRFDEQEMSPMSNIENKMAICIIQAIFA